MNKSTKMHSVYRTSPKGRPFVGRCNQCGKEGLTVMDQQREECPNPLGITEDEALLEAISGETEGWQEPDRPWGDYPIGTKARQSWEGGYWIKTEQGWKWHNGSTFPTPGGANQVMLSAAPTPPEVEPVGYRWRAKGAGEDSWRLHNDIHDLDNEEYHKKYEIELLYTSPPSPKAEPIPMVLHCPSCGIQHIDQPQPEKGWDNPPHRSHECQSCGHIWRPADVETVGVESIETKGKNDSPRTSPKAAWSADGEYHKMDTSSQVFFYEQDFYVLSNFSAFSLQWKGLRFDTSEAAYHWEKFPDEGDVRDMILEAPSAHEAFKIAESQKMFRRADWDEVKVDVMRGILRAKANQHEYVRRKLLATGDRELIEDSWRDDFWGWGPNRDGQNMLGKLWMEVRANLRMDGRS